MRLRFLVLGASLLSSASAFYPSIEVAHCAHDISDFFNKKKIGIIIVDHGSKREEANHALVKVTCDVIFRIQNSLFYSVGEFKFSK